MQTGSSFDFNPIFDSMPLVVAIGAVLVALLFLLPSFGTGKSGRKRTLSILRAAVILFLLVALIRPARVTSFTQRESGVLIVLMDQSRSMQVRDVAGGESRWNALRKAISQSLPEIQSLREDFEIKGYTFDEKARLAEWRHGQWELAEEPEGDQSDIGSVLANAVRRELGQRVLGIILLTDGASRVYEPRVELRQAAREMARHAIPLYAVSFGKPREASQARDIAVERFPDHYTVFLKNEIELTGSVRVRGFSNQPLPIELIQTDAEGNEETLATRNVQAVEDGQLADFRFPFVANQLGRFRLTARAIHQPGEMVTRNNELTCHVTVRDGGLKVLYLYGSLVGEQRRLRQSIDESADIQLDGVWVDHGRRDNWQIDIDGLVGDTDYDVTIFESVHAEALSAESLDRMETDIENGMGFMMIGGIHSFGAGGYQRSPIARILPVRMHRFERQDLDGPVVKDLHRQGPLKMIPTIPHFVTRFTTDGESGQSWALLPALQGANRMELKSRAMVLAESPKGDHLLVAGNYGGGRVLAFGGDSTWQWWSRGYRTQHKRFWRQAILWLAHREKIERDDVWIRLPQRRYLPGSEVHFRVEATDSFGEPILGVQFDAKLIRPNGEVTSLQLSAKDQENSGKWKADHVTGFYQIEVEATQGTRKLGSAAESFEVFDQDIELHDPAANPGLMASLAAMTEEVGGRNIAPEELPQLFRDVARDTSTLEVEAQTTWRFADSTLDAWPFFIVVASLLMGEWYLRKKWGLV